MSPSDLPAVAALSGQLGYPVSPEALAPRFAALAADTRSDLFVALLDDRVAGWIHVFEQRLLESDPYVEIGGLVVDEACRRSGVGRALVDEARRWAIVRGFGLLRVRSSTARDGAHAFYPALGFRPMKTQHVYGLALDASEGGRGR